MIAAIIGVGSGAWITLGLFGLLVAFSVVGCWLGAPPDQRQAIIRDIRRERAIRQWKRQQRKVRVTR